MASSNNNQQQHPLHSGAAPSGKSGLGRSAPIRTVPQMSAGIPPPLAVPQYGLAQTSSSRAPKMSSAGQGGAPRPAPATYSSQSTVNSPAAPSQPMSPSLQTSHMPAPQYQSVTQQRSNAEMQPHVVPLPPPQQTQIHPLGSPQQQPFNTQPQYQPNVQSPSQPNISSPQIQTSPQQQRQPTKTQQYPPVRKPTPSTPDEEVDAFLLSTETTNQSLSKNKTRPAPLPQTNTLLEKAKLLAGRRAWGDVIRVTNDALLMKNADRTGITHADVYSQLISSARGDNVTENTVASDDVDTIRQEACELITLRCIAHLKLRRYVDLGKEIQQLGLIPFLPSHSSSIRIGDNEATIPPSPGAPSPGGTEVVPLSSIPTNASETTTHSLSWKEGSIHSPETQDKLPSWVPFGLRIMAAQQLQYVDGSSKAIDVLYDMRDRATRTEYWSTPGMDDWCSTIDNALVNAFVRKKEWRMALRTLEDMLNNVEVGAEREVEYWCKSSGQAVDQGDRSLMKDVIVSAATVELMSRQILILLQCGALDAAQAVHTDLLAQVTRIHAVTRSTNKSAMIVRLEQESILVRQAPFRSKVNEGLLLFANGDYSDASGHFRDALQSQKEFDRHAIESNQPHGCPSWKELSAPTLGFGAEPSLTVECLNNLSLCLLYSGNMRHAIHELEGLVREDPTMYLTEGMAFNLCTLYELGSDGEECTRRKKVLQRVAKRFFLHDVGVESFRLN